MAAGLYMGRNVILGKCVKMCSLNASSRIGSRRPLWSRLKRDSFQMEVFKSGYVLEATCNVYVQIELEHIFDINLIKGYNFGQR